MADYIDRIALRDALYEADGITMNGLKILNQFPSADVEEVRHGKWIRKTIDRRFVNGYLTEHKFVCSVCDGSAFDDIERGVQLSDYCPNCGARMDKDVNV